MADVLGDSNPRFDLSSKLSGPIDLLADEKQWSDQGQALALHRETTAALWTKYAKH